MRELGGDVSVAAGMPVSYCETNLGTALRIAEELGDRGSQADLLDRLAVIATNRLRLDLAGDLSLRAVLAGRASGDEVALAPALDARKSALLCLGDAAGLQAVLTELEPVLRRHGDLFRLQWAEFEAAYVAFAAADWDEAERRMLAAIATNQRGGYPDGGDWYTAHLGWLAALHGSLDDAMTIGRRAAAVASRSSHSWRVAIAQSLLGTTLMLTSDRAEATTQLERGLAAAERDGAEAYVLRCLAPLAEVTGSAELHVRADALLDQAASASGAWLPGYQAYLSVARGWLGRGGPDRARSVLAPLLKVAEQTPWTPVLAEALVVEGSSLALLGRSKEARAVLVRAAGLAAEHQMPRVGAAASAALSAFR